MQSISIIIPIYNEIEKLPQLIKLLEPYKHNNQIILINDGSKDGTKEFLDNQNDFLIIHNNKNLGKGLAVRTALESVDKDIVMLIDGDLEIDLSNLKSLIKTIKKDHVTVGYRISDNIECYSIIEFGNRIINFIFNFLYSSNYKDVLCCLKILPTRILKDFNLASKGFDLETEIMAKISINNLNVIEKKIRYNRRSSKDGKKLRFVDSYVILKRMFSIKIDLFFK